MHSKLRTLLIGFADKMNMFWKRILESGTKQDNIVDCPVQNVKGFVIPYTLPVIIIFCGVIAVVILLLNLILLPSKRRERTKELQDELLTHAVVTGGSSGIGLSIAEELIKRKCSHISILARNEKKLEEAKNFLLEYAASVNSPTQVSAVSVDVSDDTKINETAAKLCDKDNDLPNVTMLFNVAGTSSSAAFVDTDYKEFKRLMDINYLGTAYATRAFLPFMKTHKKAPRAVIITSSQAGQLGVFGYTAYSASKFALRGLAEALHMEVARDNISVQIAFPPDTDTPGFQLEQVDKPEETRLISETSGLFQPDDVAKSIVESALKRRPTFTVYFGLEGWMLTTLTAGMSPLQTNINALCQIFLMGLLRFVSLFYLMDFRRIIIKAGKNQKME